ncbi:YheC/YheD family protein [Paenibacillus sp. WST5]|uniref:YheC/YheD family protein n=2 Tax=Paenibacillus sedimenti TaxID=2770274 RepID=A0A926QMN8_9BACL|nr:YheC/YheD family protein [Paenibacillus sedimenti]
MQRTSKGKINIGKARYVQSKWGKTKAVESTQALRQYVPDTKRMTRETLLQMLREYRMVYIKPNVGMFGNGVIRVEWTENAKKSPYSYQYGVRLRHFDTFEEIYASIRKVTNKRYYLVQKGIDLLKYKGNRFDLRVMVQQTPQRRWETTGIIGRVAHPDKIVTNFHSGGTLKPIETLLAKYISANERKSYINKLRVIGLQVAKSMDNRYKGVKEIGVDVALDKDLHPWILEVNTSPDPFIFLRLKDKRVFTKIKRYAKAYGRL